MNVSEMASDESDYFSLEEVVVLRRFVTVLGKPSVIAYLHFFAGSASQVQAIDEAVDTIRDRCRLDEGGTCIDAHGLIFEAPAVRVITQAIQAAKAAAPADIEVFWKGFTPSASLVDRLMSEFTRVYTDTVDIEASNAQRKRER